MATKKNDSVSQKSEKPRVPSRAPSRTSKGHADQQGLFGPHSSVTAIPNHAHEKCLKTQIRVKYDVGFSNTLFLRGQGANLSWEKGVPLKNVKSDEWIWETDIPFNEGEFKVLLNDKQYESGENHPLNPGSEFSYSPRF